MKPHPDDAFDVHTTDRLVIRRFRAEDAATLAAYRSDPAVARYQSWDVSFSQAQARSFIESLENASPDTPGEWFQFAVVEAATGIHIGDLAAHVDADDPRLAMIGISMATSAQGKGYVNGAAAWLLDYLLLNRSKHLVTADCDTRNSHAVALLEHLRLRREGHHLQSAWWKASGSTSSSMRSSRESGLKEGRRAESQALAIAGCNLSTPPRPTPVGPGNRCADGVSPWHRQPQQANIVIQVWDGDQGQRSTPWDR